MSLNVLALSSPLFQVIFFYLRNGFFSAFRASSPINLPSELLPTIDPLESLFRDFGAVISFILFFYSFRFFCFLFLFSLYLRPPPARNPSLGGSTFSAPEFYLILCLRALMNPWAGAYPLQFAYTAPSFFNFYIRSRGPLKL